MRREGLTWVAARGTMAVLRESPRGAVSHFHTDLLALVREGGSLSKNRPAAHGRFCLAGTGMMGR